MTRAALSDFCEFTQGGKHGLSGKHFVADGVPAYGAGGLNGFLAEPEFDKDAVILSAIGARCGKCFLATGQWASLANTQVIFPDPARADVRFLWYQLNDEGRWPRHGLAQPFIRPSDVKSHEVFLPPLDEQRRIAAILDKADALRAKRKRAIALLDSLTQSIFLEMFGDLIRNDRGFPLGPLSSWISDFESGKNLAPEAHDDDPGRLRVLKVSAVTSGTFEPKESKPLPGGYIPPEKHFVKTGDLLFSRANTAELIGATALVTQHVSGLVLPDKLWRFAWKKDEKPNPTFMHALFSSAVFRDAISKRATGTSGSMKNISKEKVLSLETGRPDRSLQDLFAQRAHQIMLSLTASTFQYSRLDLIFSSLQHRAFSGQL